MTRKRSIRPPSSKPSERNDGLTVFSVKADTKFETNKIERDAWRIFLNWCSHVPEGTMVELMKGEKTIAKLLSAGTPRPCGCRVEA